jgi:late competence protein required for DNA uptake (superfamily II DNA/RNA helicase)
MESKLRRIQQNGIEYKPTFIKCSRCDYLWSYKGKNPYIVSCPYCKNTLTIRKHRVTSLIYEEQKRQQRDRDSPQTERVGVKASPFQSATEDWNRPGERISP